MRQLIAIVALALAVISPAQLATTSTPAPIEQFSYAWTLSGKQYALSDLSLFETYINLPWGLDFFAGHGFVWGMDTREASAVYGYQVYTRKEIGGDGFYAKTAFGLMADQDRRIWGELRFEFGKRF